MSDETKDVFESYCDNLDFIKWVNSGFVYQNDYWKTQRKLTDDKEAFEDAIHFVKSLEFETNDSSSQINQKDLFRRINHSIDANTEISQRSKLINLRRSLAIAASILLLMSVFFVLDAKKTIGTQLTEVEQLSLPDASMVHLNSDSEIRYHKRTFNSNRIVHLEGEAFFEVQKGSSFIVESSVGMVQVLGTSFNVYARDNILEVNCKTGRVKVSTLSGNNDIILTKGMSCRIEKGELISGNTATDGNWQTGIYNYEGARLERVLKDMERRFGIKINISSDLISLKYTGFFEANDLEKSLQSVLWPFDLNYNRDNESTITVFKN